MRLVTWNVNSLKMRMPRVLQFVEHAIYAEVGNHLATLDLHQIRRQPIYAFFEEDTMLDCFPTWQRELLRYERDRA